MHINQVVTFREAGSPEPSWDEANVAKRIGDALSIGPEKVVRLRVLLDNSLVEVFASTGEALTTRCGKFSQNS